MKVAFELIGEQPLLMHHDNIDGSERVNEWQRDPKNKNLTIPGDDRSPAWKWQTYLYCDDEHVAMPQENIMAALSKAGAQLILKKQKTFKELTQSGLIMDGEFCDFFVCGQQIPTSSIASLLDLPFSAQAAAVQKLGFVLFSKRAKIGQAKHVRVRPRFNNWSIKGALTVEAPEITFDVLEKLFELAGRVGLGDWRPGSPSKPGPYGMFTAKLKRI